MTKSDALESFLEFLNNPEYIRFLHDEVAVGIYIRRAAEMFTNLVKEARENRVELLSMGGDVDRYFKDLNIKVDFNWNGTFDITGNEVFHRYSGIRLGDGVADRYRLLNYINDAYKRLKDHFEELSLSISAQGKTNEGRTTSLPSFTVIHNSTAFSLHEGLKRLGYISCDLSTFLDAFTGRVVTTRIQWLRANSHLTHFIKRLCSENLINDPGNDDRWPLTIKVFVKSDDKDFKETELSNSSSHVRKKGIPALDRLINEIKPRVRS